MLQKLTAKQLFSDKAAWVEISSCEYKNFGVSFIIRVAQLFTQYLQGKLSY
jgi:hypothetical protein